MHDSPAMFGFRGVFVIVDNNGDAFCFEGETAMINVIQYHKLNIFVVAILRILVEVAKKNRRNQGARRLICHSPFSFRIYRKRSCSRFGLPCQNSIRLGVTAYPPQLPGLSTSFPIQWAASFTKARISCIRLLTGRLCGEMRAPIRLL